MTNVKFINGTHNVEGNIVEICTKTSRLLINFGMVGGYKEDKVKNLMKSHILPKLPDLFTDKPTKYQHQAIVLTNVNVENFSAAIYLQESIDIYVSPTGFLMYQQLVANQLIQPINAKVKPLLDELVIGDLTIQGFPSDCGVAGGQALLVSDGDKGFGISGEVRLNGPKQSEVFHWVRKFNQKKLALFVFDATVFSFAKDCQLFSNNEHSLEKQFVDIVTQRRDLIVVNGDVYNIERLKMFYDQAQKLGRTLVLEEAFALVLHSFYPELNLTVLKESMADKKTTPNDFEVVSLLALRNHGRKYVLQNSPDQLNFLGELKPGIYLHSDGFPKVSENRDFLALRDDLKKYHYQYIECSASCHASREDVEFLVETVAAKKSVPWHTYLPEVAAKEMKHLETKFVLPDENKKLHFK